MSDSPAGPPEKSSSQSPIPSSAHATALETAAHIQAGRLSAVTVAENAFERIAALDDDIQGFNLLTRSLALEAAADIDRRARAGETLPLLAGAPIAIKDNLNIAGLPTTCSSRILEGYVSPYDATVVQKVRAAGLPILGKTNLDEFAMGSSTENSALRVTRNPWDLQRIPGGSSGGSAAVVAAQMTPLSLGSDTGGSVRQPAAMCGIVGVKPTYGLVSRYGLVAFASSLDQVSPFARTVRDAAALLQVIAGFDPLDSTSIPDRPVPDYLAAIEARPDIEGLRVGVIQELDGEGMQAEVAASLGAAREAFEAMGARVQPISIPSIRYAVAAYYILATAEASSNLGRYDGVRYGMRVEEAGMDLKRMYQKTRALGFGPEVKRRIMLGTFCLSAGYFDAFYGKAQKARALIRHELRHAFDSVDILICPTAPTTAFRLGEKLNDPVSMYLSDIATIPVNMAGIPALSLPCGFDAQGLPIGLQLLAPHLGEDTLFRAAAAFEARSGLRNLTPGRLAAVQGAR
ncbi:MAG: Asp-tRNA(Asn)/Glu-tRNA(Gln) amidotransferase subunit GatA [Vampirovibrionales bacterium]|nr:Asp-tRNA(Asn)/Glu-tRNA(Gln) amidotransferase subunit GatA [Vampirovibrionales bacterium]